MKHLLRLYLPVLFALAVVAFVLARLFVCK